MSTAETIEVPSPASTEMTDPRRMLDGLQGVPPGTRVIIADVTRDYYERMVDAVREGEHFRISYNGKNIEMMTLGPRHERQRSYLDLFIIFVASELDINRQPMGSTRLKALTCDHAIEPDLAYYFDPVKIDQMVAVANLVDDTVGPMPDLAAEVDISWPETDRPDIYVKLQVAELWIVRNRKVSIVHLGPEGKHVSADRSRFLPATADDITRWVFAEDTSNMRVWEKRLRAWARTLTAGDVLP